MSFNETEYKKQWAKNNLERIVVDVPKGKKEELKQLAKQENTTIKGLFSTAMKEKYGFSLDREK